MSLQGIEEFNTSSLYNMKDKMQKWKGAIYNLKQKWFLTTKWIKNYAPYTSTFTNEPQVFIECSTLSAIFNHMAGMMSCRLNEEERLYGANQIHGYVNQVEGIYAKMGKKWRVFDEEKVEVTASFEWKTLRQKLHFLFEIFGYFVFEDNNKEKQVKVISKIVQIQHHIVPEKGEEAAEFDNDNKLEYSICMF